MTIVYACIGATFRRIHIVGASPFGIKVLVEDKVARGDPVTLTHRGRPPIEARIVWTRDNLARIEFASPLSPELFQSWFGEMLE